MSDTLKGKKPRGYVRKPRVYPQDRVCSHTGCETRLSQYNSRTTCQQHTPVRYPRVRGRIAPDGEALTGKA